MSTSIRSSVISGNWYPGDPGRLKKLIQNFLKQVDVQLSEGSIMGLVAPHAGYMYSGQVAAYGYKQLAGYNYDLVVILSPMHQMYAGDLVIHSADYYETPLGRIRVNRDIVNELEKVTELNFVSVDGEHSLEIQLPFLQVVLKDFQILPLMLGLSDVSGCEPLSNILYNLLKDRNFLMVASTDLHHIPDYDRVVERDKAVVDALKGYQTEKIIRVLSLPDCSVCGRVPLTLMLQTLEKMGADQLKILKYANSGDVTGEKQSGQYTVGYVSAAILRS